MNGFWVLSLGGFLVVYTVVVVTIVMRQQGGRLLAADRYLREVWGILGTGWRWREHLSLSFLEEQAKRAKLYYPDKPQLLLERIRQSEIAHILDLLTGGTENGEKLIDKLLQLGLPPECYPALKHFWLTCYALILANEATRVRGRMKILREQAAAAIRDAESLEVEANKLEAQARVTKTAALAPETSEPEAEAVAATS